MGGKEGARERSNWREWVGKGSKEESMIGVAKI